MMSQFIKIFILTVAHFFESLFILIIIMGAHYKKKKFL